MNQSRPLAVQPVKILRETEEKHLTRNRTFQGIPGIVASPDGRLWATWYSGGDTECGENFVVLVTSDDGGQSWSEPLIVIDPPGPVRAFDPVVWIDPLKRLWLFWSQGDGSNGVFDGIAGVWGIVKENSDDLSMDWSEPVRIANGIMMNKPTVLSSGEWVLPIALWNDLAGGKVPDHLQHEKHSNIVMSKDNGKSFQLRGSADVPERSFDEHMIVELPKERLWMLVRTTYGIGQSFSEDNGETWSPGEDSGIKGPCSRFFIRRLQSGRLLLVNHQVDKTKRYERSMLTAWVSDDDGKSWYGELLLDARSGVSYPDGQQDADGNIYIIYDRERYKAGEILLARFREEDVINGKCKTPGSFLRRLVNRTGGVRHTILGFGEVMLRFCPKDEMRLRQVLPGSLNATFGGGEANVCASLAMFGAKARYVTTLPDNAITHSFMAEMRGLGVDVERILLKKSGRMGIYFVETGANQRGSNVIYDRAHSCVSKTTPEEYDFNNMLEDVKWVHLSGITPALSEAAFLSTLGIAKRAVEQNIRISCDLNYRKKLWNWKPGIAQAELARECMEQIVPLVDVIIGNEEDASDVFGIQAADSNVESGKIDLHGYRKVATELAEKFPKAQYVAITLRESISADHNNWGAMLYDARAQQAYFAPLDAEGNYEPFQIHDIVDRVGGGDSFAAGLIYALNSEVYSTPEQTIKFAVAASCLKHSIKGDYNYISLAEVESLMAGNTSGRVRR